MIKVDYEGAWKELREDIGDKEIENYEDTRPLKIFYIMDKLEKKHTHNYVDIRRRGDKEVADYCLKKYADMYLELVNLKNKLKKLSKKAVERR